MSDPSTTETRILLIEDDGGDAYLVQDLMAESEEAYGIVWVRSLAAAQEIIHQPIDCVLLDLGLPDSQGLDALCTLLEWQSDLAIIVLTGLDDQHSGARALELGAQDYLPKGTVDKEITRMCFNLPMTMSEAMP